MKLPGSYYNTTSFIGTLVAGTSLLLILLLFIISMFFSGGGNYFGLFTFIILPGILILGLILIPVGMFFSHRKTKKTHEEVRHEWIKIDLNDPRHRNGFYIFSIGTLILLLLSAVGSYEAYHYTESVPFCGTMCHQVMEPEHTTYQNSPHARVACVACHVGSGAGWYVKSKMSGLYQVYAVLTNSYPRPIPTPITSLRPARETCEECHWPEKFYSHKLKYEKHFMADSLNTEWDIHLKMKIGASHSSLGLQEGIHWHINPNVKIEYIASSNDRETIPWVRYINMATGDTTIFQDTQNPVDEELVKTGEKRLMDCMDCHNRPSHNYQVPSEFVDMALASGDIPAHLPQIKHIAMQMLKDPYNDRHEAKSTIEKGIFDFYHSSYPELAQSMQSDITKAIASINQGYSRNVFPEMKASWDVYPDHIGHKEYNGCFRCHNDTHQAANGKTISKDCNLCHNILLQGSANAKDIAPSNGSLEFKHPVDVQGAEKEALCSDCHRYLY
jgi:nitrate/TMAO reductase-like tetraheme cytochrome c subunit